MIGLTLAGVAVGVAEAPTGDKVLIFTDQQSGIQVSIPLNEQSQTAIVSALRGKPISVVGAGAIPDAVLRKGGHLGPNGLSRG